MSSSVQLISATREETLPEFIKQLSSRLSNVCRSKLTNALKHLPIEMFPIETRLGIARPLSPSRKNIFLPPKPIPRCDAPLPRPDYLKTPPRYAIIARDKSHFAFRGRPGPNEVRISSPHMLLDSFSQCSIALFTVPLTNATCVTTSNHCTKAKSQTEGEINKSMYNDAIKAIGPKRDLCHHFPWPAVKMAYVMVPYFHGPFGRGSGDAKHKVLASQRGSINAFSYEHNNMSGSPTDYLIHRIMLTRRRRSKVTAGKFPLQLKARQGPEDSVSGGKIRKAFWS
ncbi:hypothetical protein CDAR_319041 [Caerostris darwini]|uniref:Uncharacterized protein n=1 Tax=Caerostris darwini TaxID=1538125 RepID=A0AAV4TYE1_9ARAC|nr:hypothetical protein CDAR_319041 [Caerostris darwini]